MIQAATCSPLLGIPLPELQALHPPPPAAQAGCVQASANDDVCEVGAEILKAHPERKERGRGEFPGPPQAPGWGPWPTAWRFLLSLLKGVEACEGQRGGCCCKEGQMVFQGGQPVSSAVQLGRLGDHLLKEAGACPQGAGSPRDPPWTPAPSNA